MEFRALLSPQGQAALQEALRLQPREADFLPHLQRLQRRWPAALARAALETAILRVAAQRKFPAEAAAMYFTREALEQASPAAVARHRAARMEGSRFLLDLGCSVGGDLIHLGRAAPALGIDRDLLRLEMARATLKALNLWGRVRLLRADLTAALPLGNLPPRCGAFFDPARRSGGRRAHSVWAYQPPLDVVRTWLPALEGLAVKVSPAVRLEELDGYECEVEFISLWGELKEACLWFGAYRRGARRATLLPAGAVLLPDAAAEAAPPRLSEPLACLYEPDPAVLRAGLVRTLAARLDAFQLDPDIAYLTAAGCRETPFARCWAVEAWMPFQLKRLRAYLRERRVGRVTVKKRGSPLQPQELQRALRLKGDRQRVLFLTHLRGRPIVVVAFPPLSAP